MPNIVDVNAIANKYRAQVKAKISLHKKKFHLVGFLSGNYAPSLTYAQYAKSGCDDVGIDFELREIPRLNLEQAILQANEDPEVHGMMVYYPIFGTEQDNYIKDQISYQKDVEGLNVFWAKKLYANDRYLDKERTKKSVLPCTPLAIVKILEETLPYYRTQDHPLEGKVVTIFNRSEVVGRPLAAMLANDGAHVYSFDLDGALEFHGSGISESSISRKDALRRSDAVIGGVPSKNFPKIMGHEINPSALCLNFASIQNFDSSAQHLCRSFVPRVGPVTIAMLVRNAARLYYNFHGSE